MAFSEVFLRTDPVPVGFRSDDLIHLNRVVGSGPGIQEQMTSAFDTLIMAVEGVGASIDNIAQVSIFVRDREHLRAINPVWVELFPDSDDRPTYKFMVTDLPGGELVQLEAFAVMGAHRRVLQIPKVAHTNPIPMGVRIGSWLFSSRVLPYDPATGKAADGPGRQTECLFHNVRALLDAGEVRPEHITQGRLFLADPSSQGNAVQRWNELIAGAKERPALHVTPYGQGTQLLVMLEVIAQADQEVRK